MGRGLQIGVRKRSHRVSALCTTIASIAIAAGICRADPAVLYAGPTVGPNVFYSIPFSVSPQISSLGGGTSIGRFYVNAGSAGTNVGSRVLLWDTNGSVTTMQPLSTTPAGYSDAWLTNVTSTGQIIGYAEKYASDGTDLGQRAVRWNASGALVAELPSPFTLSSGYALNNANSANSSGVVVGLTQKYSGSTSIGTRPVMWAANGTPTVLGDLGVNSTGYTEGYATGINDAGTIVGDVVNPARGLSGSFSAVRWAAGSTTPVELGNLGTDPNGAADVRATGINAAGVTFGSAYKFVGGQSRGQRAVAWLPGQTAALELANLGTGTDTLYGPDYTESRVVAINKTSEMVGFTRKYVASVPGTGFNYIDVATAWDTTDAVRELSSLSSIFPSYIYSGANDVNSSGIVVGVAHTSAALSSINRAVYWNPDGSIVDLTSLLGPSSPWDLRTADSISDDGWITGQGTYWPNNRQGFGYYMEYALQLPEPMALATILPPALLLLNRRRRSIR